MYPVLLSLGPVSIPTYGVIVAAGWLLGARFLVSRRGELGLSEDEVWSAIYWVFAGAFIGGKALYFILSPEMWEWSFNSLRYGSVFYGGFLGAVASGWLYCRRRGFSFIKLADYYAAALALGHGIGRFGCLAAGCCYGRHTDLPWGVALAGDPSRHPTQVYEALLNLVLFGALAGFALPRVADGRWRRGGALLCYALGYSLLRFSVEFLRGDDRGRGWAGLSPSQLVALAVATAAVGAAWSRRSST
ncbi:MAG: prolipoprotein diacylglyceryl transferase [Elusimicrobia bacterium]|nr:prolipoprotein diacylglyceryl transferase [Elusimicrobiota bacterium]